MNLIHKNSTCGPWSPLSILDELTGSDRYSVLRGAFSPDVDLHEEGNQFIIKADIPGVKKENLEVSFTDNVLTIRGERVQAKEEKEKNYYRSERWSGSFERSFEFASEIDAAKVTASFKDGVLELTVPKAESAKPKQVKVEVK